MGSILMKFITSILLAITVIALKPLKVLKRDFYSDSNELKNDNKNLHNQSTDQYRNIIKLEGYESSKPFHEIIAGADAHDHGKA